MAIVAIALNTRFRQFRSFMCCCGEVVGINGGFWRSSCGCSDIEVGGGLQRLSGSVYRDNTAGLLGRHFRQGHMSVVGFKAEDGQYG